MTSKSNNSPQENVRHGLPSISIGNTEHETIHTQQSRIPIPSPGPFRRSVSLRLRDINKIPLNTKSYLITTAAGDVSTTTATTQESLENTEILTRNFYPSTNTHTRHRTFSGTENYFYGNNNSFRTKKEFTYSRSLSTITAESSISNEKEPHYGASNVHSGCNKVSAKSDSLMNLNASSDTTNYSCKSTTIKADAAAATTISTTAASNHPIAICSHTTSTSASCNSNHGRNSDEKRETHGMSLNFNGPNASNSTATSSTGKNRTPKTPHTPKTPSSLIAISPLGKLTPKTPPVTPDSANIYIDDELESIYSYSSQTSGRSTMSCDHPYIARNGTTFSGRKMKYVVHCSSYAGQVGEDYLTPTQRAQRQIRRLKELLTQARQDLEQKDSEILRLTREVVELRLFKASLSSPEDRSNSSDAVTVREATTELKTSQDVSPIVDMTDDAITKSSPRHHPLHHHGIHQVQFMDKMSSAEMQSSFADSGHFEDLTTSSVHSKDSFVQTQDRACGNDDSSCSSIEEQRQELIKMYEKRIEELIRTQDSATSEIKRSHNDRVEALLQKLAECNTRYADMVPDYEQAKERIRELEKQLEDLQRKLVEQEDKQNKMYLHMYAKGQEAERMAHADKVLEFAHRAPSRVSVPELLQQLQTTQDELENIRASNCRSESGNSHALLTAKEAISLWVLGARKTIYRRLMEAQQNKTKVDPEVTLQFLKSAIYYFLTDKENSQGHLNAIESILEFSEQEKFNINKARTTK